MSVEDAPASLGNGAGSVEDAANSVPLSERLRSLSERYVRLQEQFELYRILADTASDAIVSVDADGTIMYANPSVGALLGVDASALAGQPLTSIIPPEFQQLHLGAFGRFQKTHQRTINWSGTEAFVRNVAGEKIPVEISFGAIRGRDGRYCFTGYIRDIRRRKLTEEEVRRRLDDLAHAGRLNTVSELSGGLAHELNQPLSAICLTADLARQTLQSGGEPSGAILEEALSEIANQAERAASIVRSLRSLVRKSEPKRIPVDLRQIVGSAIRLADHYANHGKAELVVDCEDELPLVYGDPIQLEQVILNLVHNSLDAMPQGESHPRMIRICIRLVAAEAGIQICVEDSGEGISDGDYERIFENFYSTKSHGMGLGLGISRSIVESHGGRLWAEAGYPRGTRLTIQLPVPREGERRSMDVRHDAL